MTRFTNHRPLMRASVLATVVAAVGFASAVPARAADEVTHDRLLNADKEPGNWLHHHKNFSATRFSSLKDINKDNVKNLKVAWTMHLGGVEGGGIWTHGGLEGTPIVENGFMYVTDGWGSVYKIDAHGGQGTLVWKMDPKTDHDWAGAFACCGVDNRGCARWGNLVISHTLDGRLIATNKENGQVAWQRQVADPNKGEVITGAPLIVKNMAITGVAGAEYGIRGWVAATDLSTQKETWRTFTIRGKGEPGNDTWKDDKNSAASGGVLVVLPGVVTRLALASNREGAPCFFLGRKIGRRYPAADSVLRAGNAGDRHVLHDQRRPGNDFAFIGISDLTLPGDLAVLLVGRDQPAIKRVRDDQVAPQGDAAVVDAAARDGAGPVMVGLRIHLPDEGALPAMGVDLVYRTPSVGDIHETVLDDRRAFQAAMGPDAAAFDAAKVHRPCDLEVLHIVLVDILETGKPGRRDVLVVVEPVARLLVCIEQPVVGDLIRRAGGQGAGKTGSRDHRRQHGCPHEGSLVRETRHDRLPPR